MRREDDEPGVFIFHNHVKDLYYIRGAQLVQLGVESRLKGINSYNIDLYADLRNGDSFSIRVVFLADSDYRTIDQLVRAMKAANDATNQARDKYYDVRQDRQ